MTDPRIYEIGKPSPQMGNVTASHDLMRVYESTSAGRALQTKQPTLNFKINDTANFLSLSESHACFRIELSAGAGGAYTVNGSGVALQNACAIFRRGRLMFNGQTIEIIDDNLAQLMYQRLINDHWGDDMPEAGWCTPSKSDSFGVTDMAVAMPSVAGTPQRQSIFNRAHSTQCGYHIQSFSVDRWIVSLSIPLKWFFDWFKYNTEVMTNVNCEIELEVASDERNVVLAPAELVAQTNASDLAFWNQIAVNSGLVSAVNYPTWNWSQTSPAFLLIKRVVPTTALRGELYAKIQAGLAVDKVYPCRRIYKTDASAVGSQSWRVATSVKSLVSVTVFFQRRKRSTSFSLSTVGADHCGVQYVSLFRNGLLMTTNRYQPYWAHGNGGDQALAVDSLTTTGHYRPGGAAADGYFPSGSGGQVTIDALNERQRMHNEYRKIHGSRIGFLEFEQIYTVYTAVAGSDDDRAGSSEIVVEFERAEDATSQPGPAFSEPIGPVDVFCIVEYKQHVNLAMSTYETALVAQ